jgi:hypothetical protein
VSAPDTRDEEEEESDWSWTPARLELKTISRGTWETIVQHHPDFETTYAVWRYVDAVVFNMWTDRETRCPLVPWQMIEWIICLNGSLGCGS